MTTSFLNFYLYSAANSKTFVTSSMLSAFTWKMGAFTDFAKSEQYIADLLFAGGVVKPT